VLKVGVLEDDQFTRMSIVAALNSAAMTVSCESSSTSEFIALCKTHVPDAVLLDIHLGSGPNGVDVSKVLRRDNPHIGIVFLTSVDDLRVLGSQAEHPPAGTQYLTKKDVSSIDEIMKALRLSINATAIKPNRNSSSAFGHLTHQQIETLKLVADGLSNAEIARRRFIKESSVEMTISRLAKSLGLSADASVNQRVHLAKLYFSVMGVHHHGED
jgi:DNA-binding NarL/FixJ family response regulator